jgi:hypothetical protein
MSVVSRRRPIDDAVRATAIAAAAPAVATVLYSLNTSAPRGADLDRSVAVPWHLGQRESNPNVALGPVHRRAEAGAAGRAARREDEDAVALGGSRVDARPRRTPRLVRRSRAAHRRTLMSASRGSPTSATMPKPSRRSAAERKEGNTFQGGDHRVARARDVSARGGRSRLLRRSSDRAGRRPRRVDQTIAPSRAWADQFVVMPLQCLTRWERGSLNNLHSLRRLFG